MANLPANPVIYACDNENGLHKTPGTIIDNLLNNATSNAFTDYIYTGFEDVNKPVKPDIITFNSAIHNNPVVNYLHYAFRVNAPEVINKLHRRISDIANDPQYKQPDLIFYCGNDGYWHFIIQLNQYLNKDMYNAVYDKFSTIMKLNAFNPLKTVTMSKPIAAIDTERTGNYLSGLHNQNALGLSQSYLDNLAPEPTVQIKKGYDIDVLNAAFEEYRQEVENQKSFKQDEYRNDFWMSILANTQDDEWGNDFIDNIAIQMANYRTNPETALKQYRTEIEKCQKLLELNPKQATIVKGLANYLPVYKGAKKETDLPVHNLSDQMKNALGDDFISDPKLTIDKAADEILKIYPPYLLKQSGNNRDNVVIFNPLTGIWTHDDDMFHILLSTVKPYHTKQDYERMMQAFADNAAMGNRYIKAYSGSRYLLFDNCCLDVTTLDEYPTDSVKVQNLHFTNRSHLHLNYVSNPSLPVIENGKIDDGGDWDPQNFISAYANNDPERLRYLLFGLSLGLFGGHNFGVHFDIQGQSRWGKSTLCSIYKNLYGNNQVNEISYSSLNMRFPFNTYSDDTAVIWISECNAGMKPLDDERGTSMYDKLADSQVRMEVKGQKDIVVENPPQVYIDGTQLIRANNLATGPAGRTLAYELPTMTDTLKHQCYGNDINNFLSREDVMQWFVWHMIQAYRNTVPQYKQASFQMNLTVKENLKLLPEVAKKWREDLVTDNSDISDWFVNDFEPYLNYTDNPNDANATIMHPLITYGILYESYYRQYHPNDKFQTKMKSTSKFEREFSQILQQSGWVRKPIGTTDGRSKVLRKKVSDYHNINFDWDKYVSDNGLPDKLSDPNHLPAPFTRKQPQWFMLYRVPNA